MVQGKSLWKLFFHAIFIMMDIRIVEDCKIDGQPGPNDETKEVDTKKSKLMLW